MSWDNLNIYWETIRRKKENFTAEACYKNDSSMFAPYSILLITQQYPNADETFKTPKATEDLETCTIQQTAVGEHLWDSTYKTRENKERKEIHHNQWMSSFGWPCMIMLLNTFFYNLTSKKIIIKKELSPSNNNEIIVKSSLGEFQG